MIYEQFMYEIMKKENEFIKKEILKLTKGASLEIAEYLLPKQFSIDVQFREKDILFQLVPLDIEDIYKEYYKHQKGAIDAKILNLYDRKVKNMGFTVKDLKELIKDVPDDLPVEVVGRYINQEDMVMTDVGVDKKSLWFELGYEFDRAGYLK